MVNKANIFMITLLTIISIGSDNMADLQDLSGTQKLKEAWPKIEQNEQNINAELVAHKNTDPAAHPADKISYAGVVPGKTEVKGAIDATYQRVEQILEETTLDPNKDPEVTDARMSTVKNKTYTVVKERLEEIETESISHLAESASYFEKNAVNIGLYPEIIDMHYKACRGVGFHAS